MLTKQLPRMGFVIATALALFVSGCQPLHAVPTAVPPSSPVPHGSLAPGRQSPTTGERGQATVLSSPTSVVRSAASVSPTSVPFPRSTVEVSSALPVIPTPAPRDLIDLQRRLKPIISATETPVTTSPNYAIGTSQTFWVADQDTKNYFHMSAKIVAKSPHAYWYVQDGVDLPISDVQSAANYFENHTYTTEHRFFGSEWSLGIDHDVHITILIGHIPGVGGYYSTADEYPTTVNPYSNQREMIYINVDAVRPGSPSFNATVAHEFMHMIQFNVHRWQNSWVDEGSAELAAQAVTGSVSGSLGAFERQPQTQLNAWAGEPAAAIPHYGAAYLFMRYVAEHYGGFQTIGKVVAEPNRGMASFTAFFSTLHPPVTFDQVFANWVAANILDDPKANNGLYGYSSLPLHFSTEAGPTVERPITAVATQFGTQYYRIQATGPSRLDFKGSPTVRLIGANPHDASDEWWSNRGDSIDTTLTRSVDLRKVTHATLHFWLWYDIERDFDYAYVEVSTDGGRTWQTLDAPGTTSSNPNGQNYGHGFTGASGGSTSRWVPEVVDLNAYTGHVIQLRFEYVTDDSYNADGLAIDGVEIPAIGFHDSTQTNDGWVAHGFVRVDNRLPEKYLVEALTPGSSSPVQVMNVASSGRGTMRLSGSSPTIIAVAGLTPITTHHASYELSLSP